MEIIILLAGALAIDLIFGEPPNPVHPVAWMGQFASLWSKPGLRGKPVFQFVFGACMTLLTIALFALPVYFGLKYLKDFNIIIYIVVAAVILKTVFSWKGLMQAALKIKTLLENEKIDEARFNLRALVKRDSRKLDESLIISAAAESAAENAVDSFVAPLFYFLILGVPGAVGYRVVNTLDAMIGRHGEFEFLGKFAARLDDVLNIVPARLTGLLIVAAAFIIRKNPLSSWKILVSDHAKTSSPNAGWPMSAAAGALMVRFTKIGHYELGQPVNQLTVSTISGTLKLVSAAAVIWVIICLILLLAFNLNNLSLPVI